MAVWSRNKASGQVLTAAAEEVKVDANGKINVRPQALWQGEAWEHYNSVPEIWFAMNYIANAMRRIRLYPAIQPDPMQPPIPAEGAIAERAFMELERLRDADGSHGTIVHDAAFQLSIPGEGYFSIYDDPEAHDGESVRIFSTTELIRRPDGKWWLMDDMGTPEELPDKDPLVARFWRQHPQYSKRADSPMRALGALLRELLLLDQLYRSNARSRVSAGILLVPNEVNFKSEQRPGMDGGHGQGPKRDPFVDAVMNALTYPVSDEESAGNVAPGVIKVDSKFIESFRHLTFGREFDDATAKRYEKVLARVAVGLDIPAQIVSGVEGLNHWSAWLVDEDAFDSHLAPLTQVICSVLTEIFLRPALGEEGKDVMVWFDPSALIGHPNKASAAKDAFDRGVISAEAYRRYVGYSEDDAPVAKEASAAAEPQATPEAPQTPATAPASPSGSDTNESAPRGTPEAPAAPTNAEAANASPFQR